MNVSSIVVKTAPRYLRHVVEGINDLENCEVHFHDLHGRIVATIEGETIEDQMECMKNIQGLPNVYSASVMYSYCEEETARSLRSMDA